MTKRTVAPFLLAIGGVFAAWTTATTEQKAPTLSPDLAAHHSAAAHRGHRVIVQGDDLSLGRVKGRRLGAVRGDLHGAVAMEVTDEQLKDLSNTPGLAHVSSDARVVGDMAITNKVTAATSVWQGTPGLLLGIGGTPGYLGRGITVAVVDSGIATHSAIGSRVIGRVNLVTDEPGVTGDPYGHGTHIAGIIGGSTTAATYVTPAFSGGSAPSVNFVDVRVLASNGVGYTSDVIRGIDWAIDNRRAYNIRIVNLSLGHPVLESALLDPLCQAVERAVSAGLVVVASAGNYGVTPTGAPILGGITSPGNSPFAITVGATDTKGTLDPSDDVVAPYSSHGPTEYDFVVKPDVVAPGTRIVSLESRGSYLSRTYPQWHIPGSGTNAYMRISGTSMAAAVVSGGAALMLNAAPSLTPAQVKIGLQMGARYIADAGLLGGGTGQVNFYQANKVTNAGLITNLLNTVTSVLGVGSGATFRDDGNLVGRVYAGTGRRLLGILDLGLLLGGADDGEWGILNLLGQSNPLGSTAASRLVLGDDLAPWSDGTAVVWGARMVSPTTGQAVVWGAGDYTAGEAVVWGASAVNQDR